MADRAARMLLMSLINGATEDDVVDLIDYLRDGTALAPHSAKIGAEAANVLQYRGEGGSVVGTLAAGTSVDCWRLVDGWWFVSTADVAGWVHAGWLMELVL
jgi:hypothetical protein